MRYNRPISRYRCSAPTPASPMRREMPSTTDFRDDYEEHLIKCDFMSSPIDCHYGCESDGQLPQPDDGTFEHSEVSVSDSTTTTTTLPCFSNVGYIVHTPSPPPPPPPSIICYCSTCCSTSRLVNIVAGFVEYLHIC